MVKLKSIIKTAKVGSIADRVGVLAKKQVLVGIQAADASREENNDKINSAELLYILSHGVRKQSMREEMQANIDSGMSYSKAHSLYIQSHGSPLWHVPPRPVLEPAIEANKEPIAAELQAATIAALEDNPEGVEAHLEQAGFLGEMAAKGWFENPQNDWPPNSPNTIAAKGSDSPLIDTGEMRKSITHVIREV